MKDFQLSPKHDLYNSDLKPVNDNKRSIKSIGFGVIWFGVAVQLSGFISFSPLVNHLTIGQYSLAILIGTIILVLISLMAQDIGLKYGISFATSVSTAFGYKGGRFVNLIRIIPSLFFTGVNTYIGAIALNEIFKIVFGFESIILGLILNVALMIAVTLTKVKGLERFIALVAPLLIVMGIYMMYVVLTAYNVSFFETLSMGNLHGEKPTLSTWLFCAAVMAGGYISFALGMNDVSKDCKKYGDSDKWFSANKKYIIPTFIGIIPAVWFYAILGSMTMALSGTTKGSDVLVIISGLVQERSIALAILLHLFIVVAQASTNTTANMLPGAYAISSLFPKKISYKSAVYIFAVLFFVLLPLAMGDKVNVIISLFSATVAPAVAIVGIDYYLLRKRYIDLDEIYNSKGKYKYTNGINIVAITIYVGSSLLGAFFFSEQSLFITMPLAGVLYFVSALLFKQKYPAMIEEKVTFEKADYAAAHVKPAK